MNHYKSVEILSIFRVSSSPAQTQSPTIEYFWRRFCVHGVFCQTITKSCQITNNILLIILTKYGNIVLIKRFNFTMDPTLNVLLQLN